MNNYRIRLMIGSACASAAFTVLLLSAAGWLHPPPAQKTIRLIASSQHRSALSPLRIQCRSQLATVVDPRQEDAALRLLDEDHRIVICIDPPVLR